MLALCQTVPILPSMPWYVASSESLHKDQILA
jgi:hypothetical protein